MERDGHHSSNNKRNNAAGSASQPGWGSGPAWLVWGSAWTMDWWMEPDGQSRNGPGKGDEMLLVNSLFFLSGCVTGRWLIDWRNEGVKPLNFHRHGLASRGIAWSGSWPDFLRSFFLSSLISILNTPFWLHFYRFPSFFLYYSFHSINHSINRII